LIAAWFSSSGTFGTTASVPGRTTVTNSGSAVAYPVIRLTMGTAILYWIKNATTGQALYFNALPGALFGTVTIDLRPGRKTVTSGLGANLIGYLLPSSDFDAWCLAPGDNTIEVFQYGGGTADFRWRPEYWSVD
jgi:hypothetical protein